MHISEKVKSKNPERFRIQDFWWERVDGLAPYSLFESTLTNVKRASLATDSLTLVGESGFEPLKSIDGRFTV